MRFASPRADDTESAPSAGHGLPGSHSSECAESLPVRHAAVRRRGVWRKTTHSHSFARAICSAKSARIAKGFQGLTLGTVPIPAGVEAVALVAALIAAFEMTAEDCRAAHFDGGHHTPLFRGHRCAMVLSISFAVATEHVRHFQPWAVHGTDRSEVLRNSARRLNRYTGRGSKSRGLVIEHTLLVATRRYRAVVARLR
jgi:hypothetical protein